MCFVSFTLFLVAFAVPSLAQFTVPNKTRCLADAADGDCGFYDCWEAEAHCGPKGYLEGYGGKYCRRFGQTAHLFNEEGRQWIDCVRVCLTNTSLPWYESNSLSCPQIIDDSFALHPKCYVGCGFCHMVRSPRNFYGLIKTFDPRDFFSKRAVAQVYQVAKACLSG